MLLACKRRAGAQPMLPGSVASMQSDEWFSAASLLTGELLRADMRVLNTGTTSFDFTAALHTYIEVWLVMERGRRGGCSEWHAELRQEVRLIWKVACLFSHGGQPLRARHRAAVHRLWMWSRPGFGASRASPTWTRWGLLCTLVGNGHQLQP